MNTDSSNSNLPALRALPDPSAYDQNPRIDPALALRALVQAQGQPAVAAERLGLRSADELLATLVLDENIQQQMKDIMRSFMMIRLLGVATNLEQEVLGRLDELDAPQIGKLFTNIISLAEILTKTSPSAAAGALPNASAQEALIRLLPPEVRRAFQVVTSDPSLSDDDHNEDTA